MVIIIITDLHRFEDAWIFSEINDYTRRIGVGNLATRERRFTIRNNNNNNIIIIILFIVGNFNELCDIVIIILVPVEDFERLCVVVVGRDEQVSGKINTMFEIALIVF